MKDIMWSESMLKVAESKLFVVVGCFNLEKHSTNYFEECLCFKLWWTKDYY
jgi:hypothetical protein